MPRLIELNEKYSALRDRFEIVTFHDDSVKTLQELDTLLRPIIRNAWKGKPLPFPILLDSTPETHRTNFAVNFYPTTVLIDPEGRVVKGYAEALLEKILAESGGAGLTVATTDAGLTATAQGAEIKLIDANGRETILPGEEGVRFTALTFSPDGKTLAGASSNGVIWTWSGLDGKGKPGVILRGHQGPVFALAFSPDGARLASGGFDTVRLWNLARAEAESNMARHHWPSWAVGFSPDGRTLAAGGLSSVRLFDTTSGADIAEFELSKGFFCRAVAFSQDGKTLAASIGRDITTWDVSDKKKLARLEGHGSDVVHLAYRKNGLFSVSCGKGIKGWSANGESSSNVPPSAITRLAERLADDAQFLNDEAWFVLEGARGSRAQYEEVLRQAQVASRLGPGSTNYLQTLGAAFYRTGRYAEAIESLKHIDVVREAGYMMPPAWLYLALAYHKNGDEADARAALARVRLGLRDERDVNEPLLRELETEFLGAEVRAAQDRVDMFFDQGLTNGAVLAAIDADSALSAPARATARKLLPYIEAERWIQSAREQVLLRTRILQALNDGVGLSGEARPLAEAMARQLPQHANDLNRASWRIVSQPGLEASAYALALEQIETAVHLKDEAEYLNTLGVAQYRAGQFKEALATLKQSQQRNPQGSNAPEDLAFIAMAQQRLGQTEEARQTLDQLRENKQGLSAEAARFLSEAEEVVGTVHRVP